MQDLNTCIFPKQIKRWKWKFQSFKLNLEWSRLLGLLMAPTSLLQALLNTLTIIFITKQWRIQRFFGNTVFGREIQGRSPKGHNCELWTTIFSYKYVWMAWVGVIYYRKCNYYALTNCIRHCVRGEFIQIKIKFIKSFSILLIWDKNMGSHTGWPVTKPLWIRPYKQFHSLSVQAVCDYKGAFMSV